MAQRYQQPQFGGAQIDWGNPITRGLVFCQASQGPDAARGKAKTITGAVGRGVNKFGQLASFGGGVNESYPAFGPELTNATPATVFWLQEPRAGAAYSTVAQFRPSGSAQPFLIYQSSSDLSYAFVVGQMNGAVPSFGLSTGFPVNNVPVSHAIVTTTNLDSRTVGDWTAYKNGVGYTTATTTSFSGASATQTTIGSMSTGGDPFEGLIGNFCIWNRALSAAEIKSLSDNPWQIFAPQSRQIWVPTAVTITRPSSDILTSGWTGTPDNTNLFNNLDEVTSSDTDYITSPTITGGENTIMGLSSTLATGTWDVRYRANFVGSSAQVRIHLLDGANTAVGVSGWQTVTSSFADYTAQVTTSGAAVRVKIEVQ